MMADHVPAGEERKAFRELCRVTSHPEKEPELSQHSALSEHK